MRTSPSRPLPSPRRRRALARVRVGVGRPAPWRLSALASALALLSVGPVHAWAEPAATVPPASAAPAPPTAGAPRLPAPNSKRKAALPELLLLDVSVNGQRLKDVVRVEQAVGGPLLLPLEAWDEARLLRPASVLAQSDGTPAAALDSVSGARWQIDRQALSLVIDMPAGAFIGSRFSLAEASALPPPRPQPGVMLNYDAFVSRVGDGAGTSGGATLEAIAFGGYGNFVGSALVSRDPLGSHATRLESYWRYDLPQRMETLVLGDAVGVGGGWSRPVRYGGLRWGRDFSLRPGFISYPLPSLAGEAALPSTIDVLVNNSRRGSQPVQAGPFDLGNLPIVTGAGQIDLLVRDLLGRETLIQQSYYASPRLLAPGLSDYSFEAGRLRTGFGLDSHYGDAFAAATWRRGLNQRLTGELRAEAQLGRRAAGFELAGLIGTWGVARIAVAGSRGDSQGVAEQGELLQLGIERSTPVGGVSLQYEHAGRGFAPFGEAVGPGVAAARPRERGLASIGGPLLWRINAGASYVSQSQWDGQRVQALGLSAGMPRWRPASLSLALNKRLDGDRAWQASILFSLPLQREIYVSARSIRAADGVTDSTLGAMRNPPSGQGLGWRAEVSTVDSQRARGGLQYNSSHAEWDVDLVSDTRGQLAARAGGRGTVGYLAGLPFASRPVGQGSFAVVEVDGIAGVPVKRANQVVATTDANGRAFIPQLLPWQKNQIEIDPVDLPLDVEVDNVVLELTPFAGSGSVVHFSLRRSRQALLKLVQPDGQPVPVGARVRLLPSGPDFVAAGRGQVWLTDLAAGRQRIAVNWSGGGCELELVLPAAADGIPARLGPLVCAKEPP